ncbi:hypothetical protein Droror1_Dr00020178, partial [Drosera rotundifolia]
MHGVRCLLEAGGSLLSEHGQGAIVHWFGSWVSFSRLASCAVVIARFLRIIVPGEVEGVVVCLSYAVLELVSTGVIVVV